MPRRKFDTTQRGISDTLTDAPIATSICENKLVYAERIRTLRAAANLSQGELAEAMNLGRAAISNWETADAPGYRQHSAPMQRAGHHRCGVLL